jgi:hypothetical protein
LTPGNRRPTIILDVIKEQAMAKMVHALIEEEYLVKGVLGGDSLPLVWHAGSGWREFPIPLSEIKKAYSVRVLSATEADRFMSSSRPRAESVARPP